MSGFTTREVAEASGLPTSKILSWTRRGLLFPERESGGSYVFSFQDVVLLRSARELLEAHVPARRIRGALAALRQQLPSGRPLSAVHISAHGDRILVRDQGSLWEPDSGQLQMDFAPPLALEETAERAFADPCEPPESADEWYNTALDLEGTEPDEAVLAYRRALALDPDHADAHLNLGRLLHERGRLEDAEAHYRAATATDPAGAQAHYNLGVVLEDLGRPEDALRAYREALGLDERLAPAHFNLSRLCEALGHETDALGHLAAYKRLVTSPHPSAS